MILKNQKLRPVMAVESGTQPGCCRNKEAKAVNEMPRLPDFLTEAL
jgi:hypothetical protein